VGLYLYCVGDADAEATAGPTGIDGAAVEALPIGEALAWVSELDAVPSPSLDHARAHHAVVAAAAEASAALVPVRFGQLLRDRPALREHLLQRHGYAEQRQRVRGRVEMGARVTSLAAAGGGSPGGDANEELVAGADAAGGPGAAYLRQAARRMHALEQRFAPAERVADAVQEAVAELVEDTVRRRETEPPALVLAHLVQRRCAGDYARRARAAAEGSSGIRLFVTGPWPPYSFVG